MSILLTGSSGFIGKQLLTISGMSYKCVVRQDSANCTNDFFRISRLDSETCWDGAFDSVDSIIHLAGIAHSSDSRYEDFRAVNVEGTLHFAREAAKGGVKRFVFVSSIGVNGASTYDAPFKFNSAPSPHNSYSLSKYEAEVGIQKISEETGLEVVIVRPTLVYGPNAPGNFGQLVKFVDRLPLLPFGLAVNRRDFISVQNLADLLIRCASDPKAAGHTFLASDCQTVSIKDFTNAIAKVLNKKLIQLPIPVSLMRFCASLVGKSAMAEQLLCNLEVDSSNAHEVLGWSPPFTMEQAMASLSENKK